MHPQSPTSTDPAPPPPFQFSRCYWHGGGALPPCYPGSLATPPQPLPQQLHLSRASQPTHHPHFLMPPLQNPGAEGEPLLPLQPVPPPSPRKASRHSGGGGLGGGRRGEKDARANTLTHAPRACWAPQCPRSRVNFLGTAPFPPQNPLRCASHSSLPLPGEPLSARTRTSPTERRVIGKVDLA